MIVIRRFFALLLIPVFLVLFLATLLVFRINDTFLEPAFYTETLEELDVFNFIYDEGIPFAVTESQKNNSSWGNLPLGIDVTPRALSLNIKAVLPPAWLEENVQTLINSAVPYVTGEADGFNVTIELDDRFEAATVVFKDLLIEADIHGYLVNSVITDQIDDSNVLDQLPLGMTLTSLQVVEGVLETVPEPWLKEQVANVVDEITPYLIGREDTFSITIPVQERADMGIDVVEGWVLSSLASAGAYEYLLAEQISPVIQASLGTVIELPYGVTFTNEEIVSAISGVLPAEWVAERVQETVDVVGPYITGRTESFVVVIPLADRAELAVSTLVEVADQKFASTYTSLRVCSFQEVTEIIGNLSLDSLPPCRPPLISYEQFKSVVGLDVLKQLAIAIVEPLPESITLTDEQVFDKLSDNSPVAIDDLREILRHGYIFTEKNLEGLIRTQAGSSSTADATMARVEDIRGWLRDGFSFDEIQLRNEIGRDVEFDQFDRIRSYVDLGRANISFLAVLLVIIALLIGLLGGRRWGSLIAWAGIPLLLSGGGLTILIYGPLAAIGAESLDDIIRTQEGLGTIFVEKLIDVRIYIQGQFIAPMITQGISAAAAGAVMVILGMMLAKRRPHEVRKPAAKDRPIEPEGYRQTRSAADSLKTELESGK